MKRGTGRVRGATLGSLRSLVAVLLGVLILVEAPLSATAAIPRTEFPSATQVKASMLGKGAWHRSLGEADAGAVGARPSQCRSEQPFAAATEFRNSFVRGSVGRKRYSGVAQVTVYRFASTQTATDAMSGLPGFLSECARSVEWWCENCDGIATIYRTPAAARRVGEQSVAWNQRSVGMGVANGHAIAARDGSTIVVTVASHLTDPEHLTAPPRPAWKQADSVARKALVRARQ